MRSLFAPTAALLALGLAACDSNEEATVPAEGDTTIVEGDTVVEPETNTAPVPVESDDRDGVNVNIDGDGVDVEGTVPVEDNLDVRVDTDN